MSEIPFNARRTAGDIQISKAEDLNVREGGKIAQVTAAERLRREPLVMPLVMPLHHPDFLYERRQT